MRLRHLASLALAFAIGGGSLHAMDPAAPEALIAAPVQALRSNDVLGWFKSMPSEEQDKARQEWKDKATTISPSERAEFDEKLAMLLSPNAVDTLMGIVEPQLGQFNPQEVAGQLQMFGGMFAMQMGQDPKLAVAGQSLNKLVMGIAGWLPNAGIENPAKMRESLTSLVGAARALGVKNTDELFALDLEEFLARGGAALKEAKLMFKPYGIEVDSFLDSIALINVKGEGDKRTADLKFTAFDSEIIFPMPLIQREGKWAVDDNAIQQSLAPLMGGMMGGGGGAGAGEM